MKILTILLMIFTSLNCYSQSHFPYNLHNVNKKIILPAILNEVSGLTDMDAEHVACVQDEIGTIFIYNLLKKTIVTQNTFDTRGDFEGLTFAGNSIYILRSDGRLTIWNDFNINGHPGKIENYTLPLLTSDNEGLAFDSFNNRLLIAGKNKPDIKDKKHERYIYQFDIVNKKLVNTPAYILDINTLENYTLKNNLKLYGKKKRFNFSPASLAVHPKTRDIYIISANDYLLTVINQNADIIHMEPLPPDLFPQAEGITFFTDGTMIITNEAVAGVPTLLMYEMKRS